MTRSSSIAASFFLALVALLGSRSQAQAPVAAPAATPAPAPSSSDNPLQLTADHATISVADIDKVEAWYVQTFGFQEFERSGTGPDYQSRHLRIPGVFRLDLSMRKGSVRHAVVGAGDMEQGWMHIVFKTPKIDYAYQQLSPKNPDMKVYRDKSGAVNVMLISDPEGNEVELQR